MTISYKTKSGLNQFKPALKTLERIINQDTQEGFCLACGELADGVEPDARKYTCEFCNKDKVYGAEELVLMGLFH